MIRMFLKIIGWITRLMLIAVIRLTPFVIWLLGYSVMLVLTSVASVWLGFPRTIEIMAADWLGRALTAGLPPSWERSFYQIFSVIAFFTIIAGWVVLSLIMVFIVKRIF